jgi:hypothetical protein
LANPLPHSKPLQQFLKNFDGHVEPSQRRFKRVVHHPIDWSVDQYCDTDFNIHHNNRYVEDVEAVALHIPIYKLEEFLASIPEQHYKEMELRMMYPALKKAYEQYRLLLKMCGGDSDAGY